MLKKVQVDYLRSQAASIELLLIPPVVTQRSFLADIVCCKSLELPSCAILGSHLPPSLFEVKETRKEGALAHTVADWSQSD